ncbi:MAG: flagellar hook-basal body complex protein [Oscillospiraceae bacterium]|nr:flagellar hook-basal body complex protein [Oscillospiraceae bacterium]MDY2847412.1 flagellar hook-basal body complex protein [Oscillospiraceae bacterium]
MLRGFYTSANGIINENRILNIISNNLANVKTAGYKTDTAIPTTFADSLLLIRGQHSETGTIRYKTLQDTYTTLEQGTMEETNSFLDCAIVGPVYFNIERYTDGEVLLTKDGQFSISDDGDLELGNIGKVLDVNGNTINLGTADFNIGEHGLITTSDGRTFQLGLSYIEDYTDVEKVGDTLFRPYENAPRGDIPDDVEYSLKQGWYERSNVDIADEMTKALDATNIFKANAQALQIMNSINRIACNDLMKRG